MAGQVLAVASGKGGVGKTTTVVNLGVVLRQADFRVALVDADLGMANLGTMLGLEGDRTLHDVLSGEAAVADAIVEEADGFAVLTGSSELEAYPDATPHGLRGVLDELAETYDYVLVDTGAGMSHEDVLPLGLADGVLLVTTPEPAAIGDTRKTAELADLARGDVAGVVVTKADEGTDARFVAREVGADLLGVIPYDATVRESTTSATPLEAVDPDAGAAAAYRELAETLIGLLPDPTTRAPGETASETESDVGSRLDEAAGVAAEAGTALEEAEAEDSDEPDETVEEPDETEEPAAEPTEEPEEPEPADEGSPDEDAQTEAPPEAEPADDDQTAVEPTESADDEADGDSLAEFEDEGDETSGGLFSWFGRLFR